MKKSVGDPEGKEDGVRDPVLDREEVGVNPVLAVVVGEDERVGAVVRVLELETLTEVVEPTLAIADGEAIVLGLSTEGAEEVLAIEEGERDGWLDSVEDREVAGVAVGVKPVVTVAVGVMEGTDDSEIDGVRLEDSLRVGEAVGVNPSVTDRVAVLEGISDWYGAELGVGVAGVAVGVKPVVTAKTPQRVRRKGPAAWGNPGAK